MANFIRRKVSLKKKRFQADGFDLDLAYITPNLIAMGFPAQGFESLFRNPMSEVKRFLEKRHPEKYKVYNLCIEREYDHTHFHNRVGRYPFFDHSAPPLATMGKFCSDVEAWLKADESNTAAVHCKAGKGRAGMMTCCFLMHAKLANDPEDAMAFFARQRTQDLKGVTIPSQKTYIRYYHDILNFGLPSEPAIRIKKIRIHTAKYAIKDASKSAPYVQIIQGSTEQKLVLQTPPAVAQDGWAIISFNRGVPIQGDIKFIFYDKVVSGKSEMFHLWFNTAFIRDNSLKLKKYELDKAFQDKKHKLFQTDFEIELVFKDAKVSPMQRLKRSHRKANASGGSSHAGDKRNKGDESAPSSPASERWAELSPEAKARLGTDPASREGHDASGLSVAPGSPEAARAALPT